MDNRAWFGGNATSPSFLAKSDPRHRSAHRPGGAPARCGDDQRDHSARSRVEWQEADRRRGRRLLFGFLPPWRDEGGQPRIGTSVPLLAYLLSNRRTFVSPCVQRSRRSVTNLDGVLDLGAMRACSGRHSRRTHLSTILRVRRSSREIAATLLPASYMARTLAKAASRNGCPDTWVSSLASSSPTLPSSCRLSAAPVTNSSSGTFSPMSADSGVPLRSADER
jgi:hypothetical protein